MEEAIRDHGLVVAGQGGFGGSSFWMRAPEGVDTEVLAALSAAEVPASRIYSATDMFADPQFLAREMLQSVKLPDGRDCRMPGIVPKLSQTPGTTDWIGPALGEHTDSVLATLGYDSAQIAALRETGAI